MHGILPIHDLSVLAICNWGLALPSPSFCYPPLDLPRHPSPCSTSGDVLRNLGASSGGGGVHGVRLQAERVLKYGFGVSLLGVIPLTVIPLHNTFKPWLALCSPAYGVAAKQAEAAGLGTAGVQLSQLQESLLTTGILGEAAEAGQGRGLHCHGSWRRGGASRQRSRPAACVCSSHQRSQGAACRPVPATPPAACTAGVSWALAVLLPNVEVSAAPAGPTALPKAASNPLYRTPAAPVCMPAMRHTLPARLPCTSPCSLPPLAVCVWPGRLHRQHAHGLHPACCHLPERHRRPARHAGPFGRHAAR